jgi:hypothetical protein
LIATNPGFPPGFFVGGKYMMKYIFESPDRGETVYRRVPGNVERELCYQSEQKKQQQLGEAQWLIWRNILEAAEYNPALQQALDRAKLLYELSHND